MDVRDAIMSRKSVRRFLPKPVPVEAIRRIMECAGQAPSGHNIQPWKVYAVAGEARERLCRDILDAIANEPMENHVPEYDYYPTEWYEPYIGRRRKLGHEMYGLLGIARDDKAAREAQMNRNYIFFDAPVGIFVTMDNRLATGTFLDIGMFIQNILISARAEGLHTCGQAAFTWFHKIIRKHVGMVDTETLVCGIALGYEDPDDPVNKLVAERIPVDEYVTFLGF